ncbi:MAG: 1-acyl-sn-glycerol-3-phosphate acyltransferase [Colwellia sp.]|nr:1-acyl-sn-glycerol-3-phosphate acyltransferase [Colwellia sp.]
MKNTVLALIRFAILVCLKLIVMVFYRFKERWLSSATKQQWREVNFIIFLNHTSLFETLFIRIAPFSFLWRLANHLIVPGADVTFDRPIVGKIMHLLIPGCIPISRKKDDTWQYFLSQVNDDKITAILPEGRMKRRNGLDKEGKTMTVRSGFVDILQKLNHGKILFLYSGGLHHIQAPGDKLPKIFKTINVNLEMVDLVTYKQQFNTVDNDIFKSQVMTDVGNKLRDNLPS